MMWGLSPGPLLFQNEPDFCWGLIASLFMANLFTLAVAVCVIPFLIKILSVPVKYMIPIITVVCVVGAYSTSNSMYGVIVMFLSGLAGYMLKKNNFPAAPMLLSFVLSPILEDNMRKAFIISGGSVDIFFTRPITLVLMIIFLGIVGVSILRPILTKAKNK